MIVDSTQLSTLTYALQQYISVNCFSNTNAYVQVQDLRQLGETLYSGYALIMEHQTRFRFFAEIHLPGPVLADIKGVYFDASFLIGHLQSQFKPTIDNALLEEMVRRELRVILRKIVSL
jgi:hypothetical protein